MRSLQRVILCGAGALGATYAERFFALDPACIAIVAAGERRARLEREGLTVDGRTVHPRCLTPGEAAAPADLLLVGVKQHHLAQAIDDVRGFVGDATIIVSLLNGISSEEILGRAFGPEKLLNAFVVGIDAVREDGVVRYSSIGRLVFGARSGARDDPRVQAVRALLERANIPYEIPDDIVHAQWWKFMLNVGGNQVSAVLRAPFGAFVTVPEVRELARLAALEVMAVATHEGVLLTEADLEAMFALIARLGPDGKTSMLQDVEAGRKTELEIFAGTVVELGRRHGVPTPVNAMLGQMLAGIEGIARSRGAGQ